MQLHVNLRMCTGTGPNCVSEDLAVKEFEMEQAPICQIAGSFISAQQLELRQSLQPSQSHLATATTNTLAHAEG